MWTDEKVSFELAPAATIREGDLSEPILFGEFSQREKSRI
jgi:hypothetical protein